MIKTRLPGNHGWVLWYVGQHMTPLEHYARCHVAQHYPIRLQFGQWGIECLPLQRRRVKRDPSGLGDGNTAADA